mmetsp:Transcript_41620/g.75494  ORF Transcript_41620/g.75494 Transcript_41620/m.75494 type:complete len:492 (-) Transcript_41620:105-1580(-)
MAGGQPPPWEEMQRILASLTEGNGDENADNEQQDAQETTTFLPRFMEAAPGGLGLPFMPGPGLMVFAQISPDGPRLRVAVGGPPGINEAQDMINAMGHAIRHIMEQRQAEQERAAHPPACELVRDALPRVVVTKEDLIDSTNSKCSVCLEDYQAGAHATRMLCGHLFCTSCIRDWLRTANSCPVCRFELRTNDDDYEVGRNERMRDRKVRLKEGDLRAMRVPDLRRLMRALGIRGEGCVEKGDLIDCIANTPAIDVSPDKDELCYEEAELRDITLPLLRALADRHGVRTDQLEELDEKEWREELLQRFATRGWMGAKSMASALEAEKQKELEKTNREAKEKEEQKEVAEEPKEDRSHADASAIRRPSRKSIKVEESPSKNSPGASASAASSSESAGAKTADASRRRGESKGVKASPERKRSRTSTATLQAPELGHRELPSASSASRATSSGRLAALTSRHTIGHLPSVLAQGAQTPTAPSRPRLRRLPTAG